VPVEETLAAREVVEGRCEQGNQPEYEGRISGSTWRTQQDISINITESGLRVRRPEDDALHGPPNTGREDREEVL
jgi:hypothetical protein